MASLNLSQNGASISKSYQAVIDAPAPTGPAASSPTYGQWAVFTVSTPLVTAFQQDSAGKESILKVQSSGEGELADLAEEFSDGRVQFAFVKVRDPNTGLPKNVLIAWCGEGVPERTKGYFTSHLTAVSKVLHGYHVQITARSDTDLNPTDIIHKVADSSGSKYSVGITPLPTTSDIPKPTVASKPAFTPSKTTGAFTPLAGTRPVPVQRDRNTDDDGWGADAPPVTRTQLEKVPSAYRPTKVDMVELLSQKDASVGDSARSGNGSGTDVVKGGYQPIGKVDIAAIRREARESGQKIDNRPELVKGSYEPVGKVDIAAIRAKAQGEGERRASPISAQSSGARADPNQDDGFRSLADRSSAFTAPERLTSLPKPKVASKFGTGQAFAGTKPPLPGVAAAPLPTVGGASRTFADQGGKTPSQLWAEKKSRERGGDVTAAQPVEPQTSGSGAWTSGYSGKSWAPVQTTHTAGGVVNRQQTGSQTGEPEPEGEHPQQGGVGALRDRFANVRLSQAEEVGSGFERSPSLPPTRDVGDAAAAHRAIPDLPGRGRQEPEDYGRSLSLAARRSPTPESPVGSPIRVAMPVARGPADEAQVESHSEEVSAQPPSGAYEHEEPPHATPTESETTSHPQPGGEIQAVVVYDYEKAEDNEIELHEGEIVTSIEMIDDNWWVGVNVKGEQGLFPQNYVEIVEQGKTGRAPVTAHEPESEPEPAVEHPAPAAAASTSAAKATATALYDYEAAEDNELSFPEGATITGVEFPDEDWWVGEYQGRTGLFPANYVQLDG